jgi:hypothetical protein
MWKGIESARVDNLLERQTDCPFGTYGEEVVSEYQEVFNPHLLQMLFFESAPYSVTLMRELQSQIFKLGKLSFDLQNQQMGSWRQDYDVEFAMVLAVGCDCGPVDAVIAMVVIR